MDQEDRKAVRGRPKKQESEAVFIGFTQASIHDEYFRIPTMWINVCAEIDNLAELKVVQYVMRHTWGYQEYGTMKQIKLDEFVNGRKFRRGERAGERMDFGTGLSQKAVIAGLERAVKHGFLVCTIDESDKARVKKYYALKVADEELVEEPELEDYEAETDLNNNYSDLNDKHPDLNNNQIGGEYHSDRTKERTLEQTHRTRDIREASPPINVDENIRYLPPPEQRQGKSHTAPAFLRDALESFSRDLGDYEHIGSNISQAHTLYVASGLPPDAFMDLLYEAKDIARKASIKKVNSQGWPNRMPYFFKCLRDRSSPNITEISS